MADKELFNVMTYDYVSDSNILDIPDTFTNIGTLTTGDNEAGLYEFVFSLAFIYSTTTSFATFRWRIDGGTWTEFQVEPKDVNATNSKYYGYPGTYIAGVHVFEFEIKKGSSGNVLDVQFIDLMFKRVGL